MPARIHIVIGAHLCMSPRGQREAMVLRRAGHLVTVSGVSHDREKALLDQQIARRQRIRFRPALEMSGHGTASRFRRLRARAEGRLARERFRLWGTFHPALLGYGSAELLKACLAEEADLTIVHSEAGLWLAHELLERGRRVGVDFEDWFSQDLREEDRRERPVVEMARLENELLRRASYRLASSQAMACALSRHYAVAPPTTVTNSMTTPPDLPVGGTVPERADRDPFRLHWFSQTIGPGRGLEMLFAALPLVRHPVQVSLRGACPPQTREWIARLVPEAHRAAVQILAPVAPWDLPARVAGHDVGLALETNMIRNRDLCLANKFFHYLQAGLAIIATDTQGQREGLAPCPGTGILPRHPTSEALAEAIDLYAGCPDRLRLARTEARIAAMTVWNGEGEEREIVAQAERALG